MALKFDIPQETDSGALWTYARLHYREHVDGQAMRYSFLCWRNKGKWQDGKPHVHRIDGTIPDSAVDDFIKRDLKAIEDFVSAETGNQLFGATQVANEPLPLPEIPPVP